MEDNLKKEVLSNVRYLRNIRSFEPKEIGRYISKEIDTEEIRNLILENAFEIGIIENVDGSFSLPREDPILPKDTAIKKFPQAHAKKLESMLKNKYGDEWFKGESGKEIRERIRKIKNKYYRGEEVSYDEDNAFAYAIYHLPGYYAAMQYILNNLSEKKILGRKLRVLDVGAGVGGPALGFIDYIPQDVLLEYNAVEPNESKIILEELLSKSRENVHINIYQKTAEEFEPDGVYDIILFANVISELKDPISVVRKYSEFVAKTGSMILIAPADKNTAIELRNIERKLSEKMNIYFPDICLWTGKKSSGENWSFEVMPELETPSFQGQIDKEGERNGEFLNIDVQVAYSILRWDTKTKFEHSFDVSRIMRLSDSHTQVTKRVDVIAVKLSHNLGEDKNALFLIGDGSEKIDHYIVVVKKTLGNQSVFDASYGEIILIKMALVLWNEDENACNLVIDDQTTIERTRSMEEFT